MDAFAAAPARLSDRGRAEAEFTACFAKWIRVCPTYDWQQWDGHDDFVVGADFSPRDPVKYLLKAPVFDVLKQLAETAQFGHLPAMALHSCASIGPLLSQSFCERVNSCGN